MKFFSSISVSRIVSAPKKSFFPKKAWPQNQQHQKPQHLQQQQFLKRPADNYDICIKAKAIARSSGAEAALNFGLNSLKDVGTTGKSVLINTILSAFGREGSKDRFWQLFDSKVIDNSPIWSPQLIATSINQIANELREAKSIESPKESKYPKLSKYSKPQQSSSSESSEPSHCSGPSPAASPQSSEFFNRAAQLYTKALQVIPNDHVQIIHLHNAFLKLISRLNDVPFLMWLLKHLNPSVMQGFNENIYGIQTFVPSSNDFSSSLSSLFTENSERFQIKFDSISLSSIMATLSNSPLSSIALAEDLWTRLSPPEPDSQSYYSLLHVYRNDLSRLLKQRKLIRSKSWRERKMGRVEEILVLAKIDLLQEPKFLSLYYEICENANLREKILGHCQQNLQFQSKDEKVLAAIQRAQNSKCPKL